MITDKQRAFIASLFDSREITADVNRFTGHIMGGKKLALYSKSEASKLIGLLLACKPLARVSKPVSKPASGLDLSPVPAGRYAVPGEDGKLRFVIIDKPENGNWKGWAFAKVQASDDLHKLGSQKPGSSYTGKAPELLKAILANPSEASKRYGHEIGKCGVCGRTLTDEVSRANGIGPICAEKYGW